MKKNHPFREREPRDDLKRPSQQDDYVEDVRKKLEPKSQFAIIRQDRLSRKLKK